VQLRKALDRQATNVGARDILLACGQRVLEHVPEDGDDDGLGRVVGGCRVEPGRPEGRESRLERPGCRFPPGGPVMERFEGTGMLVCERAHGRGEPADPGLPVDAAGRQPRLGEQRLDHLGDDGLLRGNVVVQRRHVHGQPGGDAAQRDGGETLLIRHLDGDRDDVLAGQARTDHGRLLDDSVPTL
jgi:hypothetical protein